MEQLYNVVLLSPIESQSSFQNLYTKVRSKEGKIIADDVLNKLLFFNAKEKVLNKEWKVRLSTYLQLKRYFKKVNSSVTLLEVGCGNGWFASRITEMELINVVALDVNMEELIQGARVFKKPNLNFHFGNIFEEIFAAESFDFILLNACVQYFENISVILNRLLYFLKPQGEIHITDSPFYNAEEIEPAKQRSENYYSSIGFPEMAAYYYHHSVEELKNYNYQLLASKNRIQKIKAVMLRKPVYGFP